jgi:Leucine Rich repeat
MKKMPQANVNYTVVTVLLAALILPGCGKDETAESRPTAQEKLKLPAADSNRIAGLDGLTEPPSSTATVASDFPSIESQPPPLLRLACDFPVTPQMLEELAEHSQATELLIDRGVVSDNDLQRIVKSLPELEHLRIRLSPITDEGAEKLSDSLKLRVLNLPHSRITAVGINHWKALPQLQYVRLGGSQLDDAALVALAQLPALQSLHLIGPEITAAGLTALSQSAKLKSLYVDDCQIDEVQWQKFRDLRPDIHIHLDQNHPDRLAK